MRFSQVLPEKNPFGEILEAKQAHRIMAVLSCFWSGICHEPGIADVEPFDLLTRFVDEEEHKDRKAAIYGRNERRERWMSEFMNSALFRYVAAGCFVRWRKAAGYGKYQVIEKKDYPEYLILGKDKATIIKAGSTPDNPYPIDGVNFSTDIIESPPEHELYIAYIACMAGTTAPCLIPQVWVGSSYRLDFAVFWRGQKYAVEVDGQQYHASQEDRARDAKRARFLNKEGYRVVRYTAKEILTDPLNYAKDLCKVIGLL